MAEETPSGGNSGGGNGGNSGGGNSGGGDGVTVPDTTNWSQWTFATSLKALTGDEVDLRALTDVQWFQFNPAGATTKWKLGETSGMTDDVGYHAFGEQRFGANIDYEALETYEGAVDDLDTIVQDTARGKRGALDYQTLTDLRLKVKELETFLDTRGKEYRKWATDLDSDNSEFKGRAASIIQSRLDQFADMLEFWSAKLQSNHGMPVSEAVENAQRHLRTFLARLSLIWLVAKEGGIRNKIRTEIYAETWAIHRHLVSHGIVHGTPEYVFDSWSPWAAWTFVFKSDIKEFYKKVNERIALALSSYPKGDLREPQTWKQINKGITAHINGWLDGLDRMARDAIAPLYDSYVTLGKALKELGDPPVSTSGGDNGSGLGGDPPKDIFPDDLFKDMFPDDLFKDVFPPDLFKDVFPDDLFPDGGDGGLNFDPNGINLDPSGGSNFDPNAIDLDPSGGSNFDPNAIDLDPSGGSNFDPNAIDLDPSGGSNFDPNAINLDPSGGSLGPNGEMLGPDGQPVLGPNGELLGPNGEPLLGPNGGLLGPNGEPLLGPNGEPLGPEGQLLGPNGMPILGPMGQLLGRDGQPLLGRNGELLGPNGEPLLGPNGELLGPNGEPLLGPNGELLGPNGEPILGPDGRPLFAGDTGLGDLTDSQQRRDDPGGGLGLTGLDDLRPTGLSPDGQLAVPPAGPLPGGNPPGSGGLSGGSDLAATADGLPGGGNLPAGQSMDFGNGAGAPVDSRPADQSGLSPQISGSPGGVGMGGMPFMPPMGGMGGGGGGDKKERERQTWLSEDEKVWGTEPTAGVGVIGRPDDEDEAEVDMAEFVGSVGPVRTPRRTPTPASARQATDARSGGSDEAAPNRT